VSHAPAAVPKAQRATQRDAERVRVLALLRRFGWNASSFQVLEPSFRYFFDGDDACVAYVATAGALIAAGAPIADEQRLAEVAQRFVAYARSQGRRAIFFGTERRFVQLAPLAALRIGEQPEWQPAAWHATLASSRSLREQLRRARAKGVRIHAVQAHEVAHPEQPRRRAIEDLIARWSSSRSMAPMAFLVRVHLFDFAEERRIFVAETEAGLCGLLGLIPVYARDGWFLEDLLRAPDAPNGTTELLIDRAMRETAADGCEYVALGLSPLAGDVDGWLRAARKLGRSLYDFSGLRAFKAKFLPRQWAAIYLSFPVGNSSYLAIYDTLAAFAQGRVLRFGIATLLRGPDVVLRALMLALLPWTFALASLDAARYFPAAWVKWAWVGLDVGLLAALYALTRHFRRALGLVLTYVIAADAVVTCVEALLFNLPRAQGYMEHVALVIAVCAPAFAAVVLKNAWKRRSA
jgi:phosphatidylglycerol lysyltransferase